jgi:hypothetical protein
MKNILKSCNIPKILFLPPSFDFQFEQFRVQNKAIFYFHFDIFIFENKVAWRKMELDRKFALCSAAVECLIK